MYGSSSLVLKKRLGGVVTYRVQPSKGLDAVINYKSKLTFTGYVFSKIRILVTKTTVRHCAYNQGRFHPIGLL